MLISTPDRAPDPEPDAQEEGEPKPIETPEMNGPGPRAPAAKSSKAAPVSVSGSAPGASDRRPSRKARSNEVTIVTGKKGMGKTTLARAIYRARIRNGGSGVWVDPTGENADLGTLVDSVDGARRVVARAWEARRPYSVVVTLGWDESHDGLWRFLYEVGSLLLVLDDPSGLMSASRIDPELERLIELGRNREVDILATVRRPPELHGSIKNAADVAVVFRQGSRHYAEVCNNQWFYLPDGADLILQLPKFRYLRAGVDGRVTTGEVTPGV